MKNAIVREVLLLVQLLFGSDDLRGLRHICTQ